MGKNKTVKANITKATKSQSNSQANPKLTSLHKKTQTKRAI